jgi:hypothetical protein
MAQSSTHAEDFCKSLLSLVQMFRNTFPGNAAISDVLARLEPAVKQNLSFINTMLLETWVKISGPMRDAIVIRDLGSIKAALDAQTEKTMLHEIGFVELMSDASVPVHSRAQLWVAIDATMESAFNPVQKAPVVPVVTPVAPVAAPPVATAVANAFAPDKIGDTIRTMAPQFLGSMNEIIKALKEVSEKPEAQVALSALNISKDSLGVSDSFRDIMESLESGKPPKKKKKSKKHRENYEETRDRLRAKLEASKSANEEIV